MFAIFLQLFLNIQRKRIIIKHKHLDMVYLVRVLLSFKTLAITKAIATNAQIGALGATANATRSEHIEIVLALSSKWYLSATACLYL
jgi:hypothetical protein